MIIEIEGGEATEAALVTGDEVLIGQTVLETLDLLVDCKNQRLIPNPKHPEYPVFRISSWSYYCSLAIINSAAASLSNGGEKKYP
ncbi:hypothetical protein NIES4073_77410 [Kalymmatonema gypsitolerans NIES-4073]|nr:hypothetical protein NIES4073_77410 [Scytonema sp. NIES-4073]